MQRVLFMLTALAAAGANGAESLAPSPMAGLMQMLVGLAIVVAVIGALAWAMKRVVRPPGGASTLFKTIASEPLGPRERVVAIEIGDTWLILGVTANSISTLHTLARGELPAAPSSIQKFNFQALLARTIGRHETR